ncbi:MAG: bifunctional YncE family protein/alkaline phosphatase family protein [Candidatus Eremiobacteraeota bacterium]|nr:bifunctional YncE family protein/alkaline phosphatase family protein [Candidatus Eremiobacteraeota bacterium]
MLATGLASLSSFPGGETLSGPGAVLPNGWRVTPTGAITSLGTLPLRMVEHPSGRWLAISNAGYGQLAIAIVDENTGQVASSVAVRRTFYGLTFSPDGTKLFASTAASGGIARYDFDAATGVATEAAPLSLGGKPAWVNGIAVSSDGKTLYAAVGGTNRLAALDSTSGAVRWSAKTGEQPYAVVLSPAGKTAYVSNWSGASVTAVDTASGAVAATIPVGSHPNAEAVSADGGTLYVACANDNTVAVIDTAANRSRAVIDAALYRGSPEGATPNGLALTADGRQLFVADADQNAVVALDLSSRADYPVLGAVPVGAYPTDVAVSRDGRRLFVLDGKGESGHANSEYVHSDTVPPSQWPEDSRRWYVGALTTGALERLPLPSNGDLAFGLAKARANARYKPGASARPALPPIKHVIYVIKENRTYDEVLGDDPRGNGDPALTIFGRRITPNIHRLADEFVLFDDFQTDAEVSADGHNWSTAAYATDYVQKLWPSTYADRGRGYDYEGSAASAPSGGYIWDDAIAHGVSVRNYGEFVRLDVLRGAPAKAAVKSLEGRTDPNFHGFDLGYSDQDRLDEWQREFQGYVRRNDLPGLEIVRLPDDHTAATKPGARTPFAMIASNDYALGRMVDALSHSPYWKDTIIFSLEDDAQAGPDHVSDQRAEASIAGAYVRRGYVDHTHYTTSGVLHTIEILLKLPPMSQFDAGARPVSAALSSKADLQPWTASKPLVSLTEINGPRAPGAKASSRLDLRDADRADVAMMNALLFRYARELHERR